MNSDKIRIIYIAGHGRSGSTLLEEILGQVPNLASIGELRHIWHTGFPMDEVCGCGKALRECEFWASVVQKTFGGFANFDHEAIHAVRQRVDRTKYIPFMLSPFHPKRYDIDVAAYGKVRVALYRAIQEVSGAKIIVDSSKDIASLYLLPRIPPLELHVVLLVRDSRAVAYSWQRQKVRTEVTGKKAYMQTYAPRQVALEWTYRNFIAELARGSARTFTILRYEDFVQNPRPHLAKILQNVGLPDPNLDFIEGDKVQMSVTNHTISGNPIRFHQGVMALKLDREWQNKMATSQKLLVTLISSPQLLRHRYPLFPKAGA
jgi:hypothetical protein